MEPDILSGTFGLVIIIFSIVLFILWFLLPFAVFGVKGRLDTLINQNKQIISLLQTDNHVSNVDVTTKIDTSQQSRKEPQVYNSATGKMQDAQ